MPIDPSIHNPASQVRSIVRSVVGKTRFYALVSLARTGYLRETGWLRSYLRSSAMDAGGQPIPWIVYPCIHFLAGRIHQELTVFEYGCGNSTLWWASRVKHVVACEHDRAWYEKVRNEIPGNVTLKHFELSPDGAYARSICDYRNSLDIVMIDGRDRVNCAKHAIHALNEHGVIIWDNSERKEDAAGQAFLMQAGFRRLDFYGLGPINPYAWQTSIFYRPSNCLGI